MKVEYWGGFPDRCIISNTLENASTHPSGVAAYARNLTRGRDPLEVGQHPRIHPQPLVFKMQFLNGTSAHKRLISATQFGEGKMQHPPLFTRCRQFPANTM